MTSVATTVPRTVRSIVSAARPVTEIAMLIHPHAKRTKDMYTFILIEPTFIPGADDSAQDLAGCNLHLRKKSATEVTKGGAVQFIETAELNQTSSVRNEPCEEICHSYPHRDVAKGHMNS